MRLAVFTSKYPARLSTFFERDMRGLLDAGVQLDIFAIYPLDEREWRHTLDLLGPEHLSRDRVHHASLTGSLRRARPVLRRHAATWTRDALAVLAAALRYGPIPLAKTGYVLPKAWAWAARHGRQFDHVLAYWGNYAGTCAWAFHRLLPRPVPFSLWLHAGTDLYDRPVFLREKMRYADNVLTCCEFNCGFISRRYPELRERMASRLHVFHHGLDLSAFPCRPEGRQADHIVAVGRLAKDKGFQHLVRAAHVLRLQGVDVTVEIVGDGPERRTLSALASGLGIEDRVQFRGWLPFPDARQAMSRATLLVHPSDRLGDGLPNVVREAMALGTPVIASRVAGLPDALADGCGVLVPPRDVPALARAIQNLLADPGERRALAARARTRVEERYDMWKNGERLAALLRTTRRQDSARDRSSRGVRTAARTIDAQRAPESQSRRRATRA